MAENSRRIARELVLKGLYAEEIGEIPPNEVLEKVLVDRELSHDSLDFARGLYRQVREKQEITDAAITRFAKNWILERIAVIDRIIMRIAMTELLESPDVPVKVVLNEAIEMAKLYSTSESSKFINGILDSFVKDPTSPMKV